MAPTTAPPVTFAQTRDSLHRLARYVITPARRRVDEQTWLQQAFAGFGTPRLSDGTEIRVADTDLVVIRSGESSSAPITTLAAAATLIGVEPDPSLEKPDIPGVGDVDEPLRIDPAAARWLAEWYAFGYDVLGELRAGAATSDAGVRHLWSHHFDPAVDLLSDAERRRGTYGCSPGDRDVEAPYLYVAPWHADEAPVDAYWNATTFRGAILELDELLSGRDSRRTALAFFRRGRDLLASRF